MLGSVFNTVNEYGVACSDSSARNTYAEVKLSVTCGNSINDEGKSCLTGTVNARIIHTTKISVIAGAPTGCNEGILSSLVFKGRNRSVFSLNLKAIVLNPLIRPAKFSVGVLKAYSTKISVKICIIGKDLKADLVMTFIKRYLTDINSGIADPFDAIGGNACFGRNLYTVHLNANYVGKLCATKSGCHFKIKVSNSCLIRMDRESNDRTHCIVMCYNTLFVRLVCQTRNSNVRIRRKEFVLINVAQLVIACKDNSCKRNGGIGF